ncbi:MAG: response regulator [Planctomycetes bacterium]|nr:response regulator [Planctomycetota bacterium]
MDWFRRRKKIEDLPAPPVGELRKRTRILVIDDDPHSFPFDTLRKEGYAIDYWPKVENLRTLEEGQYDVIFLDIQGVAQDYAKEDGLGVLEYLKEKNPSQIVVAFSAHSYDLSKNRFWRLADDSLSKPVEAVKCKQLIDNLIESKRTPAHYWQAIADSLRRQGLAAEDIERVEDKVVRALTRKDRKAIAEALDPVVKSTEMGVRLVGIAFKIAGLFGW